MATSRKPQVDQAAPKAAETAKKDKKPKLVRDSFTIPKSEYEAIAGLKARALKLGASIKKSELLRAGLKQLAALPDAAFKQALADVPTLKTGRPMAEKPAAAPAAKPATKAAPKAPAATKAAVKPAVKPEPRPATPAAKKSK